MRVNADGLIEYLGRIDLQVKVRGFRIEPGEVEQRILEHPQVAQVHVCTRRQAAEDHQLLAFIVPREALDYRDFDQHLRDNLAVWMRPHQLFVLQRLPLTANGKIDQRALLEQPLKPWRPQAGSRAEEQHSPTLDWLLTQARRLLAQPELNGEDDWLGSGGDSLKAMRLRSAIRTHWRREITLGAVLSESFSALAERLGDEQGAASAYPPAPPVNHSGRAPATAEQSRLWLMQQRTPQATAYNVPIILHLAAGVQLPALADAVQRLLTRHSGLRTAFVSAADGLHQEVHQRDAVCQTFAKGAFSEQTWRSFAALVFDTPFDLATSALCKAWLLPFADGSCRLLLNLHHVAIDGWSMNLLFDDPGATVRRCAAGAVECRAFAGSGHAGVCPLATAMACRPALPRSASRPGRVAPSAPGVFSRAAAGSRAWPAGTALSSAAGSHAQRCTGSFCSRQRVTRYEVLFSVYAWSIYALTGCERPRIASPVSNRPLSEFEDAIGMFANTVLIPTAFDGDKALGQQLHQQTATVREVLALQDVVLADLVEDLRLSSSSALFDFMFVLENTDYARLAHTGLRATLEFNETVQAKCPLTLLVVDAGSQLECWWEYQCSYFDAAQMVAVNQLLQQGLDLLLEKPSATLDALLTPYRFSLPPASQGDSAEPPFNTVADWFAYV